MSGHMHWDLTYRSKIDVKNTHTKVKRQECLHQKNLICKCNACFDILCVDYISINTIDVFPYFRIVFTRIHECDGRKFISIDRSKTDVHSIYYDKSFVSKCILTDTK